MGDFFINEILLFYVTVHMSTDQARSRREDAGDDRHDSVICGFVYMKVALEAGLRRETIHGRPFSEIVFMKITL